MKAPLASMYQDATMVQDKTEKKKQAEEQCGFVKS